jgi:pimeloyl-ACP methyl ester carboxylesterase
VFYYDRGTGQPLVLIHGMWGDHRDWETVLDPLAAHHRVIAVDLPGFGETKDSRIEYTGEFFAHSLARLLDQLGLENVALAGNSFGGQIAMSLALEFPARVNKLILVDTGGLEKYSTSDRQMILEQRNVKMLESLTPEINSMLFGRLFFSQNSEAQQRYIARKNARLARPDYPEYCRHMFQTIGLALDLSLLDRIGSLAMPVLLIHGEKDVIVNPDRVRAAVLLFPNARLVMLQDCGHIPQLEQPERFLHEVNAFLEQ